MFMNILTVSKNKCEKRQKTDLVPDFWQSIMKVTITKFSVSIVTGLATTPIPSSCIYANGIFVTIVSTFFTCITWNHNNWKILLVPNTLQYNFDKIFFYGISKISRATTHFSEFATCFYQCLIQLCDSLALYVANLSLVHVQWSAEFVTVIELSLFDPLLHLRSMTSQLPVVNSTTPRSKFS